MATKTSGTNETTRTFHASERYRMVGLSKREANILKKTIMAAPPNRTVSRIGGETMSG